MSVAAVVLAAGGSARFGKPKQLAVFRGETFVRRIVRAAIDAGCAPVVVVTGEDSAQVILELTGIPISVAVNPQWSSGLGSSIGVGVRHAMDLAADLDAAVLLTCDQPFVNGPALTQLIELLRLKGDHGAKKIIFERRYDVAPFNFPAAAIDIDTVGDYEKLDQSSTCTPGHSPAEDQSVPVSRRTFLNTTGAATLAIPPILRAQADAPSSQRKDSNMEIKRIGFSSRKESSKIKEKNS